MSAVHYDSYTDARAHLKDLLDAAEKGHVATVRRESARTAVVDVERLRHLLASLVPLRA
ncbi:MAG: type II toxin-antitoxin system prevent-host-death family antitoxin [Pseudonocardiaceae bacterium]